MPVGILNVRTVDLVPLHPISSLARIWSSESGEMSPVLFYFKGGKFERPTACCRRRCACRSPAGPVGSRGRSTEIGLWSDMRCGGA